MRIVAFIVCLLAPLAAVPASEAADEPAQTCRRLTALQTTYGAPLLEGEVGTALGDEVCWEFWAEPGDVYGQTQDGGNSTDIHVLLLDANGNQACTPRPSSYERVVRLGNVCRLTGEPPFRYVMRRVRTPWSPTATPARVLVQLFDVGGPLACPPHDLSDFGATSGRFDSHLPYAGLHCWSIVLPAGPTLLTDGLVVTRPEDSLQYLCTAVDGSRNFDRGAATCRVPEETPALLFDRQDEKSLRSVPDRSFVVVPPLRADGCEATVGATWDASPVTVTAEPYRMSCWTIDAPPGSPLLAGRGEDAGPTQIWVFDGDGRTVCHVVASYHDICDPPGSPPYRLVAWSRVRPPHGDFDDRRPFQTGVRLRRPASGCATGPLLAFGERPPAEEDSLCRVVELDGEQGLTARVRGEAESRYPWSWVFDEAGNEVCGPRDMGTDGVAAWILEVWCPDDLPEGRYLIAYLPVTEPRTISAYDPRSRDGCHQVADLVTLGHTASSQVLDCYLARGTPGETLDFHRPLHGWEKAALMPVEDGRPVPSCPAALDRIECTAADDGTLQVLGGGFLGEPPFGVVATAFERADLEREERCPTIPRGTTRTYPTTGSRRLVCVRVPDAVSPRHEPIYAGTPTRDEAERFNGYSRAYGECGRYGGQPPDLEREPVLLCWRYAGDGVAHAILELSAGEDTYSLYRPGLLYPAEPPPGPAPEPPPATSVPLPTGPTRFSVQERPRLLGRAVVGRSLRVTVGRVSPRPARYTVRWSVDGVPVRGATGRRFTVNRGHLGGRVSVRISMVRDRAHYVWRSQGRRVSRR